MSRILPKAMAQLEYQLEELERQTKVLIARAPSMNGLNYSFEIRQNIETLLKVIKRFDENR